MAKIQKTVVIDAPVEKVFNYLNDPVNLPEVWPNLVEIRDVQWLPSGGNSFRFVYEMAGIRFKGSSTDIEFIANRRVVSRTKGGIDSTTAFNFQPQAGRTKLTLEVEYTVPIPLLGRLAEAIIVKINEKDMVYLLNYLKLKFARVKT